MSKGMFDYNRDGRLDANEQAAEMMFIEEVIENEDAGDRAPRAGGRPKSRPTGISFAGKPMYDAKKDSDGVVIAKSLLVTGLCVGGFVVPIATDMDGFGMIVCIFIGIGLSMMLLKNT